ncbi:MAG: excinuclease ABC subunit UvrC [Deltaproteobacteria bacterium]|nr:excinuclease ABC subunit UvrC [Deltaproteobacteria bacterium]
MTGSLQDRVDRLPHSPGVYLFKDAAGSILYVGKAVDLRARVRQYLGGHDTRPLVPFLLAQAVDVEVVLVDTEKEALILEATLVRRHQPPFNVLLRDDKNFLHVRIDAREPFPRVALVRTIQADGARYFGPYHSAQRARQTLQALHRHFPLRSCTDEVFRTRRRPCLRHQMHRCSGPCVGLVTAAEYREIVEEAVLFLSGRTRELVGRLTARMERLAEEERFEEAIAVRDLVRAVEATLERQRVVDPRLGDRDAWGIARLAERVGFVVLPVRGGHLVDPETRVFEGVHDEDAALVSSLVNHHYDALAGEDPVRAIPSEILLPIDLPDRAAMEEVLSERRGRRVHVATPSRGRRADLVRLAVQNATDLLRRSVSDDDHVRGALEALARACRLRAAPRRMECFDNSNLQGQDPVAAMVAFVDGRPLRAAYRRYRVRSVVGADDYATMREILGRRFRRGLAEGDLPDLVVVDGGHGQVNAARAVLADLGLPRVPVVGIVKPRSSAGRAVGTDRIVLPDVRDPVVLKPHDPALRLLQHLRDEAHASAIRYHRQVRSRRTVTSALDALPGVGPSRRTALLAAYGSVARLREASPEAIARLPGFGPTLAARIHAALHPQAGGSPVPPA